MCKGFLCVHMQTLTRFHWCFFNWSSTCLQNILHTSTSKKNVATLFEISSSFIFVCCSIIMRWRQSKCMHMHNLRLHILGQPNAECIFESANHCTKGYAFPLYLGNQRSHMTTSIRHYQGTVSLQQNNANNHYWILWYGFTNLFDILPSLHVHMEPIVF